MPSLPFATRCMHHNTHVWVFLNGYVDLFCECRDVALGFRQDERLLLHSADLKKTRPHLRDLCNKKRR